MKHSQRNGRRKFSLPTEEELLQAFDRHLQKHHPNPERIGCPGANVLQELAKGEREWDAAVLDHIRQCAPCVDEVRRLRCIS